jgi:glycosyltransferase involved in cell wall biosynthesis
VSTNSHIELSVIILCYRSGESIIEFSRLTQQCVESINVPYEIVLVGNYFENSGDNTKEIVEKIAANDSHFKAICRPKEGMMGWDMREGLSHASGNFLCVIDGDGQFPIGSIKECYKNIKKGDYDIVKSYRSVRNDGFYRRFISSIYNLLFKILFPNYPIHDVNSKPKIISKVAYDKMILTSNDWFIDAEIMINARRLKLSFFEFPVEFAKLEGRMSFVKFQAIIEFLTNLIRFKIKEIKGGN